MSFSLSSFAHGCEVSQAITSSRLHISNTLAMSICFRLLCSADRHCGDCQGVRAPAPSYWWQAAWGPKSWAALYTVEPRDIARCSRQNLAAAMLACRHCDSRCICRLEQQQTFTCTKHCLEQMPWVPSHPLPVLSLPQAALQCALTSVSMGPPGGCFQPSNMCGGLCLLQAPRISFAALYLRPVKCMCLLYSGAGRSKAAVQDRGTWPSGLPGRLAAQWIWLTKAGLTDRFISGAAAVVLLLRVSGGSSPIACR